MHTSLPLLLALLTLSACGGPTEPPVKRVRKAPGPAAVTQSVVLPGEDGRVHVVTIPGRYETSQCVVHVGPAGSSLACLPALDTTPAQYEVLP